MATMQKKTGWLVPALAVALFAGVTTGGYFAQEDATSTAEVDTTDAQGATQGQQVVAMLEALPTNPAPVEVTRTTSVDLLGTTAAPAAEPVNPDIPSRSQIDATVALFENAQPAAATQDSCREDLGALASEARVYFPTGGLAAGDAGLASARLIGQVLLDCPGYAVQVEGHSDASGNPEFNMILSERRANAVLSRLASAGIDTTHFVAIGMGDTQPSGITGPEEDAFYDRRVEFSIVESSRTASLAPVTQTWQPAAATSSCVQVLQEMAAQTRVFYAPRGITAPASDMAAVKALAVETQKCDGARLRLIGQHADTPNAREHYSIGRLRVLAMMSSLVSAGVDETVILTSAPSRSISVEGQPALPNSRVDFQIVME